SGPETPASPILKLGRMFELSINTKTPAATTPMTMRNAASARLSRRWRLVNTVRFRIARAMEKNAPIVPALAASQILPEGEENGKNLCCRMVKTKIEVNEKIIADIKYSNLPQEVRSAIISSLMSFRDASAVTPSPSRHKTNALATPPWYFADFSLNVLNLLLVESLIEAFIWARAKFKVDIRLRCSVASVSSSAYWMTTRSVFRYTAYLGRTFMYISSMGFPVRSLAPSLTSSTQNLPPPVSVSDTFVQAGVTSIPTALIATAGPASWAALLGLKVISPPNFPKKAQGRSFLGATF